MPDSPILRALVTPLALILVFFTFARACTSSMKKTRAAEFAAAHPDVPAPSAPAATAPATPAKDPRKMGEIEYPPGLTKDQIAYHVSVNSEFAAPMTATAGKNGWGDGFNTLHRLGYLEDDGNAGFRLSRDGNMKLRILSETSDGWTFFVTQRVFDDVSSIRMLPDGNAQVSISWHWEANDVARAMGIRDQKSGAVAEFRSNENAWTLFRWASSLKAGSY